jgi:acetyl esterase/lipase
MKAVLITILCLALVASAASAEPLTCATVASDSRLKPLLEAQPHQIAGATSYVYKSVGGTALRLHVFAPPGSKTTKRPAIVFFFGGAWIMGTVNEFVPKAKYFAGRGMVAIVADYRVFCRDGVVVADEVADAKSAVRWVRSHADELAIDPNRIVASGGSSGGHLALSTAMFNELDPFGGEGVSARPDLLVLFYPCVDETTEEEQSYGGLAIASHGADVSPLFHIEHGLPPTLIFQGTADSLAPSVERYCAEAKAHGNQCELVEYAGAHHGFLGPHVDGGQWNDETVLRMDRFLVQAGYLAKPAPAAGSE